MVHNVIYHRQNLLEFNLIRSCIHICVYVYMHDQRTQVYFSCSYVSVTCNYICIFVLFYTVCHHSKWQQWLSHLMNINCHHVRNICKKRIKSRSL